MAEEKLIPTITVVEESPPEIDIITYYELLLDLPNILQAFIGQDGGEVRNGIVFDHGDAGLTMKNYPERIDSYKDSSGDLIIMTDDTFDGDADNYYLDEDGDLRYYFPDIPFHPTDFAELKWGIDFTDTASLTLSGNLIEAITQMNGGSWTAAGSARPQLIDGAAVLNGTTNDLQSGTHLTTNTYVINDEMFIVAKKPVGITSYFLLTGRTWVGDGDNKLFGSDETGKAAYYNSNNSGGAIGEVIGTLNYPDGEYQLWWWKNVGGTSTQHAKRVNGFLDETSFIDTTQAGHWISTHGADPASELSLGKRTRVSPNYYPSSIKEILYFSNLDAEKRKCIEVYLKYKHSLPVYDHN